MKAMIFAAGLGTRLRPLTDDRPKALVMLNGKTLLEHCILFLGSFGIRDVVVNVHHFADKIVDTLATHNGFGSRYAISDERDEVLETGGGLKKAAPLLGHDGPVLLVNVDILTNLDLRRMCAAHAASGALATLAVMHRTSSRHLLFDDEGWLAGWENTGTGERRIARTDTACRELAFSGVSVIEPEAYLHIPYSGKFSLIDVYLDLARRQVVKGYDHTGDILVDVGKPESLQKASALFV